MNLSWTDVIYIIKYLINTLLIVRYLPLIPHPELRGNSASLTMNWGSVPILHTGSERCPRNTRQSRQVLLTGLSLNSAFLILNYNSPLLHLRILNKGIPKPCKYRLIRPSLGIVVYHYPVEFGNAYIGYANRRNIHRNPVFRKSPICIRTG